ncbi:MAG: FHA domain-containing protein [Nitrososphaerales archaeon]
MAYLQQNDPESTRHALTGESFSIGRAVDNDVVLDSDMRVSRRHAEIANVDGQWVLQDCSSRNGTYVDRERISRHPLRDGDRFRIGQAMFLFVNDEDPFATQEASQALAPVVGANLSAREKEILTLVATGSTDAAIASALVISLSTVRSHLDRIREKTGCRRRSELTRLALELKLTE